MKIKFEKVLDTENVQSVSKVLAKVLVDRNSSFLKSIIINKGSKEGIIKECLLLKTNI